MIHKSLNHTNIVKFEEMFEDAENVYLVLELCHNGVCFNVPRGLTAEHERYREAPRQIHGARGALLHGADTRRMPEHAPKLDYPPRLEAGQCVPRQRHADQDRRLWSRSTAQIPRGTQEDGVWHAQLHRARDPVRPGRWTQLRSGRVVRRSHSLHAARRAAAVPDVQCAEDLRSHPP